MMNILLTCNVSLHKVHLVKGMHDYIRLRSPTLKIITSNFSLGAAYCRAEKEITKFVEKFQLPFLPTPMGKGVVSDVHPLCVAAARSRLVHCILPSKIKGPSSIIGFCNKR